MMMPSDFDPYDALIDLNERMLRMEKTHNALARAFQKSEQELSMALESIVGLQKIILSYQQQQRM